MDYENLPLIGPVFRFGAEDRVLDTILLAGPLVVLTMIVFGQSPVARALVGLYVATFAVYVVYNGVRR
ncbi:hypothetical protein [Halosimplex amylolyticum]|uniref:hypothetical protein n=1 Tax=Halosimplex amylolyticum TaxID=3396616 RepID=UPI003F545CBB